MFIQHVVRTQLNNMGPDPRFCDFVLAHEVLKPRVAAACEKLCRHGAILSSELNRKAACVISVGKVREDLSANLQMWLHTYTYIIVV